MRSNTNPLEWPVVEHYTYLLQALSFDSAIAIHDWPYGMHLRCIKRIWSEQAIKGSQKHNWRNVGQTTTKEFNNTYTTKLDQVEDSNTLEADYEQLRLVTGKPFWNKPDESEYHLFACWEQVRCKPVHDLPDEQATLAVRQFHLTLNATHEQLILFLDRVAHYRERLSPQQIISLKRVETIGRRYNPSKWPTEIKWQVWGLP